MVNASKYTKLVLIALMLSGCSKANFSPVQNSLAPLTSQSLSSVVANTKKNTPVTFSGGTIQGSRIGTLSFGQSPGVLSLTSAHGLYTITDAANYVITYTPNQSFVGTDPVSVYATDSFGHAVAGSVEVVVGNVLNLIQPALAVRGASCITCHSGISSNLITDYGAGSSWFFDSKSNDSFYFDRTGSDNGLSSINLLNHSQLIVPKVTIDPSVQTYVQNLFGISSTVTTLAEFAQARFAQGSPNATSQVTEVNSLTISIPTAARIQQVFNNPTANQVYIPDTQNSPSLSGLTYDSANKVFIISNLTCDGDLYLGATVLFENATVTSVNGCRIYATQSIFIDGPLTSAGYQGSANYNTQLLSTVSIWMGTGRLIDNTGAFCDPKGWYSTANNGQINKVDCTNSANEASPFCDTFYFRAASMGTSTVSGISRNTFSRAYPNINALEGLLNVNAYNPSVPDGSLMTERERIETHLGRPLYDASCGTNGRNVAFKRLMLVAPYVNNRYSGDLSGATIAEAALMSLGTFTYQFDPVFNSVSILSLLDPDELISGDGL